VLVWVVDNSMRAMQRGLLEWASKGLHFAGENVCVCVRERERERERERV